jgi:hypothetical protein
MNFSAITQLECTFIPFALSETTYGSGPLETELLQCGLCHINCVPYYEPSTHLGYLYTHCMIIPF